MPDVHAVEVDAGRAEPLPDFLAYLNVADRWNCPPMQLVPGQGPPLHWWMRATLLLADAEGEARRRQGNRR